MEVLVGLCFDRMGPLAELLERVVGYFHRVYSFPSLISLPKGCRCFYASATFPTELQMTPFISTPPSSAGHLQFPSPIARLRIIRDICYQGEPPLEPLPYCLGFILPSSIYSDTVRVLGLKTSQWLPLCPYY